MKITANTILKALSDKHWQDIFISECKTGPSGYKGCVRLDAWVMKKSWANPLTIGYEIKVSRSDFLNDRKWQSYLPYCNEFYFVSPFKLILPSEIPADVGLLWLSSTGTRLFTKKKAPYRQIIIPEELYRYIMMWRSHIISEYHRPSPEKFWKDWMEEKEQKVKFGSKVGKRIQVVIKKEIESVNRKNKYLIERMEKYDEIKKRIEDMGFDVSKPLNEWEVFNKLQELKDIIPSKLVRVVKSLREDLNSFQIELDRLKGE